MRAEANNSASGLGKEIKINLNKTPYLNITWKIEKDLHGIKEDTKNLNMFDDSKYKINNREPIYNFDKGYKPKFVFNQPKRMIIPDGMNYNKEFYGKIKDL